MKLVSYHFRDKTEGWIHFSVKYSCDDGKGIQRLFSEDPFMKSFLSELNLRPSCYHCMFKGNAVPSDLLIGDYWGVQTKHPELYDKDGVSIVVTNTEPGKILLENIHASVSINEIPMEDATQPAMTSSAPIPKHRDAFSRYMQAGESFSEAINRLLPQKKHTFVRRAWRFAKRKIARILGQKQNNVSVPVLAPFHSWYIVDPQNDFSAKQSCCGCSACQMVCPVHAIVMKQDEEGFPYPSIENDVCIHCDACRRVCPILAESSKERKTEPFHPSARVYRSSQFG